MAEKRRPPGASGVFQALVTSARKLKRALSESDTEVPPVAEDIGNTIGEAFVENKLADLWGLSTTTLKERAPRESFVERWSMSITEKGPFTGFEVSNAGAIDLHYVPGLEEVPQSQFVAFLEIVLGSEAVPLDHEKAFAVGVVLLFDDGQLRIGAIHAR